MALWLRIGISCSCSCCKLIICLSAVLVVLVHSVIFSYHLSHTPCMCHFSVISISYAEVLFSIYLCSQSMKLKSICDLKTILHSRFFNYILKSYSKLQLLYRKLFIYFIKIKNFKENLFWLVRKNDKTCFWILILVIFNTFI